MDCNECNKHECQNVVMSKYAYERERAKDEYALKRAYRIILAVVIGWIFTIGMFVFYLYQYDFVGSDTVIEAEDGIANYADNSGEISNGDYYGTEAVQSPQKQK